jgi:phage baseplate assembly protein W
MRLRDHTLREVDFLGKGWAFPISGQRGSVQMAESEESIGQSIWIILATAPGERIMRPDFGCGIHELVFAVNDITTRARVAEEVRTALIMWEPRIDLLGVTVETKGRGEILLINIEYRVRSTNNHFNMVFPFYLEQSSL